MVKQLVKQWLRVIGLDVRRWQSPKKKSPPWTPPDISVLPDYHLYTPFFSPWTATEGDFHALCERVRPYTLLTPASLHMLHSLARQGTGGAPDGEFWECGVYKGGTAMLLADVLTHAGKHTISSNRNGTMRPRSLRLFDTFEGLPEADPTQDFHKRGEFADTSQVDVAARVPADFIRFHVGLIPQTFAGLEDRRIAFAHVDVDLYRPILDCCRFIYPRLVPGGIILFDDYGRRYCPGARKAVDEFFADKLEVPLVLETGQAVVTALPDSRDAARQKC